MYTNSLTLLHNGKVERAFEVFSALIREGFPESVLLKRDDLSLVLDRCCVIRPFGCVKAALLPGNFEESVLVLEA